MRARNYYAQPNIRDHLALRCMNRCPVLMVCLKRDLQCLRPQASLVLIYRPNVAGMKGRVDLAHPVNRTPDLWCGKTNLARLYDDMSEKIVKESEDFENRDSGWTQDEIVRLEVRSNRYSPFRGSSSFIEVLKQIAETKAIINVINKKDSQCFMWSILAALYPNTSNPNKTSSYVPHLNKLIFDVISFPTPLNEDIHDYLTELGSERERNLGVPSRVSNLGVRKKGRQTKIGDKICVRESLNSSCKRLYFAAVYFCILERILFRNTISFSDWSGVSGGISSRGP
ncbi:c2H2-type domain-containing protein [Trichonephila clavipes]|nr:c2H2-type domain-containing protein [Trichonephila clavipes]